MLESLPCTCRLVPLFCYVENQMLRMLLVNIIHNSLCMKLMEKGKVYLSKKIFIIKK